MLDPTLISLEISDEKKKEEKRRWSWNTLRRVSDVGCKLSQTYGIFCNQFDAINFVPSRWERGNWMPLMSFHLFAMEDKSATETQWFLELLFGLIFIFTSYTTTWWTTIPIYIKIDRFVCDFRVIIKMIIMINDRLARGSNLRNDERICDYESNAVATINKNVKFSCHRSNFVSEANSETSRTSFRENSFFGIVGEKKDWREKRGRKKKTKMRNQIYIWPEQIKSL